MHPNSLLFLTALAAAVLLSHAFHIATHTAPDGLVHDLISRAKQDLTDTTTAQTASSFQLFSHASLRMVSEFSASLRQNGRGDGTAGGSGPSSAAAAGGSMEEESPEPSPEHDYDHYSHSNYYDHDKHEMQWRKRLNKLMDKRKLMHDHGDGHDDDDNDKDECGVDSMAPHGAVAIALDYNGPSNMTSYVDKDHGFLRYAMGFTKKQIKDSKMGALEHFKYQFGIDFNLTNATYNETMGTYTDEKTGYMFAPLVYNVVYRLVGHSHMPIYCADAKIITGGWTLLSMNGMKVYGKAGGEKGMLYGGYVEISSKYYVVLPATRMSTRLAFFSMMPFSYNVDYAGPLSGVVYNFDDDAFGWMDGTTQTKFMDNGYIKAVGRSLVMFPGRPRMMADGIRPKHYDYDGHDDYEKDGNDKHDDNKKHENDKRDDTKKDGNDKDDNSEEPEQAGRFGYGR